MRHIKGNLLTTPAPCIMAHACNSLGVMGAGLALQVKLIYPSAFYIYVKSGHELGTCSLAPVGEDRWVANLITQSTVGRTGRHTNYQALRHSLRDLAHQMRDLNITAPIYVPQGMGCGLGGGDWGRVTEVLEAAEVKEGLEIVSVEYVRESGPRRRPRAWHTLTKTRGIK